MNHGRRVSGQAADTVTGLAIGGDDYVTAGPAPCDLAGAGPAVACMPQRDRNSFMVWT